jgi:hypothetical protein
VKPEAPAGELGYRGELTSRAPTPPWSWSLAMLFAQARAVMKEYDAAG